MAIERFRVPAINSLMPSTDARNSDEAFVLDGRNFQWDSKGPKTGYPSKMLSPYPFYQPSDVQGIRVEDHTVVFNQDGICEWRDTQPIMWDYLYTFVGPLPLNKRTPWSAIFLNGVYCFAQESRGFFQAVTPNAGQRFWIHQKTNINIPGLISGILGMAVVRGRAILVNATTIQWGAQSNVSDFTPTIGGAGFQLISNFVKGTFLAITTYQDGFVVWTTEGAVLAEYTGLAYVGNDNTWRFSAYNSAERPYSLWSTTQLINGGSVYLSRRGLKIATATEAPKDFTPEFNEYFRDYLDDKAENSRKWRLEYDQSTETIYLSESTNLNTYWRTFVLKPTLNKWGIFSDSIYGFLPLSEELYGYVDINGYQQYLNPKGFNRETEPDNALGFSPFYPRMEKQQNVLSSSAVSRDVKHDGTQPITLTEAPKVAWYNPKHTETPQQYGLTGLDSWLDIGYLRPSNVQGSADMNVEFQELVIGSYPSAAASVVDFPTQFREELFYTTTDDYNSQAILVQSNQSEDWNIMSGSDDLNADIGNAHLDYNKLVSTGVSWTTEIVEDLMAETGIDDLMGPTLGLPEITYGIKMLGSTDGITFAEFVPMLARFDTASRTWSMMTQGSLHRLRISATAIWQAARIEYLEATVNITGGKQQ